MRVKYLRLAGLMIHTGRVHLRQGLLERNAENSYLADDDLQAGPME